VIRDPRPSGYTLIEVLGAFFIMTIILTLVTGIFVENGRQRKAALGMMEESLAAAAALDLIARDVEGAVYLKDAKSRPPDDYAWRFAAEEIGELGARSLRFVTQNAPAANRAEHASSWVEVVYFLEEDEEEQLTLWRWVSPRPPTELDRGLPRSDDVGSMRIAIDVADFGARMLGPEGDWLEEWDSAYQSPTIPMPAAVELSLQLMREARVGESEEGAETIPGPLHVRRVAVMTPPIDVVALVQLAEEDVVEELECFTIAQCISEGDSEWYHDLLESDCDGDEEMCGLLSASEATCWDEFERSYPGIADQAPESCFQ
jgi:type II secretory pathway component PulJ